jgi:hypothetical protein
MFTLYRKYITEAREENRQLAFDQNLVHEYSLLFFFVLKAGEDMYVVASVGE